MITVRKAVVTARVGAAGLRKCLQFVMVMPLVLRMVMVPAHETDGVHMNDGSCDSVLVGNGDGDGELLEFGLCIL